MRPELETPPLDTLKSRLPSVHAVLYLLFNEGYLSAHAEQAIRRELCDEAIRLDHAAGGAPGWRGARDICVARAHAPACGQAGGATRRDGRPAAARGAGPVTVGSRTDASGRVAGAISDGDVFSRFHAEAGIAAEHCFAPSFEHTRWKEIADLYAMLEHIDPSPLHTMNRAVAVAEWQGPDAGLAFWKPSYRLRGWLARTCGMPSSAICIGAQATWRSHNGIATVRSPRRLLRPCETSSGAGEIAA